MSTAEYALRFDDICPTMNWTVWDQIETLLDVSGVKPILAVVPENRDPKLMVDPPSPEFWPKVRYWQSKGWSIAVHGCYHVYDSWNRGLVGTAAKSEFAGHSYEVQQTRIDYALDIFGSQNVRPNLWVAPSHTFDRFTIEILLKKGINIISDGHAALPGNRMGAFWIPEGSASFSTFASGFYTICSHHNHWSDKQIGEMKGWLQQNASRCLSVDEVFKEYGRRDQGLSDRAHELVSLWKWRRWPWLRPRLSGLMRRPVLKAEAG